MALGTLCVTTNVGDATLIVGDTGWVIPAKDPHSLANTIRLALDEKNLHNEQWNERKTESRNRIVNNFSIEKMVGAYKKVWFE